MEQNTRNAFFDFDEAKVQILTLDQLERTHKENDIYGKPVYGIYHYALIGEVLNMAAQSGYNAEVYDLFAAQNRDRNTPGVVLLPQVEAQFGQHAVEAHILRRVFANIRLTDMDDDTYTTNIAIAFHQRGIQAGFGNMVKICHNQCMLSASSYASTYGDRGSSLTIEQLLEAVGEWIKHSRETVYEERDTIDRMKQIDVPVERLFQFIGQLTVNRVACDTRNEAIRVPGPYPLNQAQITQFAERMLLCYHDNERVSVWDLYNNATELYKANAMEIPNLLPQNRAMCGFIREQFDI